MQEREYVEKMRRIIAAPAAQRLFLMQDLAAEIRASARRHDERASAIDEEAAAIRRRVMQIEEEAAIVRADTYSRHLRSQWTIIDGGNKPPKRGHDSVRNVRASLRVEKGGAR